MTSDPAAPVLVQCVDCAHWTMRRARWERPGDAERMARAGWGKCSGVVEHAGPGAYLSATWARQCVAHTPVELAQRGARLAFCTPSNPSTPREAAP